MEEKKISLFRSDGVYVQPGTRVWWADGMATSELWYNLYRVNEEMNVLAVLGTPHLPFYDEKYEYPDRKMDYGRIMPKNYRDYLESKTGKIEFEQEKVESVLGVWKNLGIKNPNDILSTAIHVAKLPFESIQKCYDVEQPYARNIELWDLDPYEPEPCEGEPPERLYMGELAQQGVADWMSIYFLNEEPLILYDNGSPCRQEFYTTGEYWEDGKEKMAQKNHEFPYYFVPLDLSREDVWCPAIEKWNVKFQERLN